MKKFLDQTDKRLNGLLAIMFCLIMLSFVGCSIKRVDRLIYSSDGFLIAKNVARIKQRNGKVELIRDKTMGEFIEDSELGDVSKFYSRYYEFQQAEDTVFLLDERNGIRQPCFLTKPGGKLNNVALFSLYAGNSGISEFDYSMNMNDMANDLVQKIKFVQIGPDGEVENETLIHFAAGSFKIQQWQVFVLTNKLPRIYEYRIK